MAVTATGLADDVAGADRGSLVLPTFARIGQLVAPALRGTRPDRLPAAGASAHGTAVVGRSAAETERVAGRIGVDPEAPALVAGRGVCGSSGRRPARRRGRVPPPCPSRSGRGAAAVVRRRARTGRRTVRPAGRRGSPPTRRRRGSATWSSPPGSTCRPSSAA